MPDVKRFAVIQLPELKWPTSVGLSGSRFRLFVAADIRDISTDLVSEFATAALAGGMVYFCSWGRDCGRFHDIVDEVILEDEVLGERRFVAPNGRGTIMTTWHENQPLEEALDFFTRFAVPNGSFAADSRFWLVLCVGNANWAETATRLLQSADFVP